MNGEQLLAALSGIDERLIGEAEEVPARSRNRRPVFFAAAAAACLCAALTGAIGYRLFSTGESAEARIQAEPDDSAEILSISADEAPVMAANSAETFEIRIRVTEVRGDCLLAVAADSDSTLIPAGTALTVVLPEGVLPDPLPEGTLTLLFRDYDPETATVTALAIFPENS